MKKAINLTLSILIGTMILTPIFAGDGDDAKLFWTKHYRNALRDLRFGSTFEKINAARLMGAHHKSQFIRPLGAELLIHLERQKFLKMSTNDPFVKTQIAWALGEIEHELAVPDLLRALDISLKLVKTDNEAIKIKRDKNVKLDDEVAKLEIAAENKARKQAGIEERDKKDKYKVQIVTMGYDRPGPILNPGHAFPNSADMNWSTADEFKGQSYNYKYEDQRVRMIGGANWMNLARAIFASLGKIADESAVDGVKIGDTKVEGVKKYLKHPLPLVRSYAAQSLGDIAENVPAASLVLKEMYGAEKDERVKIYMAYAILQNDKSSFEHYKDLLEYIKSPNDRQRYDSIRVLSWLAMGESEQPLREALRVESRDILRKMLRKAIYNAEVDNVMPVNY